MKKLTTKSFLALFGLIMFANMANAQNMSRYIELTVQQGQWIQLDLLADVANTKVKVVSGTKDTTLTVDDDWTGFLNYYADASKMKVYGNVKKFDCSYNIANITDLDASNNIGLETLYCGSNNISSLNVSGLTALKELYCDKNNLSSLDVSGLTNLKGLYCYTNNISSVKISSCDSLNLIFCDGNNLSACGLDSLFHQLPIRPESNKGVIYIKDLANTNPGTLSCRDTIATNRNWEVLDFNGDNGDINIVNTTYACPYFTIGIEDIMVNNLEAEIYPNPASNFINVISENANEIITISDLSGKIVYSEKASEKQTSINVSQLSAGMYIVRVGDKVTKFVKE